MPSDKGSDNLCSESEKGWHAQRWALETMRATPLERTSGLVCSCTMLLRLQLLGWIHKQPRAVRAAPLRRQLIGLLLRQTEALQTVKSSIGYPNPQTRFNRAGNAGRVRAGDDTIHPR